MKLFRVDRYGWTWLTSEPTPAQMRKRLVEEWTAGNATEWRLTSPGRRDVTA